MNWGFSGFLALLVLAQICWVENTHADIVPTEDFETLSAGSGDKNDEPRTSQLQPEIAIEAGAGTVMLPYSPPGLGTYENGMRFTSFRFGLFRTSAPESFFSRSFYSLKLKNSFPASGRSYDLQAVSWIDITLAGGIEGEQRVTESIRLRWLVSTEAVYERIHYPRGTLALYGMPVRAGAHGQYLAQIAETSIALGLGVEFGYLGLGRTAVKHDAFPISNSATANQVMFQRGRSVTGQEISASLDFDFSNKQWLEAQGETHHKHQISLIWGRKIRDAKDVAVESNIAGAVQASTPLELNQTSFGLRWSERL